MESHLKLRPTLFLPVFDVVSGETEVGRIGTSEVTGVVGKTRDPRRETPVRTRMVLLRPTGAQDGSSPHFSTAGSTLDLIVYDSVSLAPGV